MSNFNKIALVALGLAVVAGAIWYAQFRDFPLGFGRAALLGPAISIGSSTDFRTSGDAKVSEGAEGLTVEDKSAEQTEYYRLEADGSQGNSKQSVTFHFKPLSGDATAIQLLVVQRAQSGAKDGQVNFIMNTKEKSVTTNGVIDPNSALETLDDGSWTLRAQVPGIENPKILQVVVRPSLKEQEQASILIKELSVKTP